MKGLKSLKSIDIDTVLKLLLISAFFTWNLIEGAVFENQYPYGMVSIYRVPIWRVFLVLMLVFAADWCPSLSIMIAFFIFFYIMDMEVTLEKWSIADLGRDAN